MQIELLVGLAALAAAPAGQNARALYDRGVTWQAFHDAVRAVSASDAAPVPKR